MTSETVQTFEKSLSDIDVTLSKTTADEFTETLSAIFESPAVGVPLPFDGLSLSEFDVTFDPTPAQLREASLGITPGGPAIAEYGSVVVRSGTEGTEQISLYPTTHVAVVPESSVVPAIADAIDELAADTRAGLTSAVLTTGPSVTADMGAPVTGVHGPQEVHVILLSDR